ncbi:hypothetical protein D3C80_1485090 [compost metagenome]
MVVLASSWSSNDSGSSVTNTWAAALSVGMGSTPLRRVFKSVVGRVDHQIQLAGQALAGGFIGQQTLQVFAKRRDVAHGAFECNQGFAQFQQLVQFGYLAGDGVGAEVVDAFELKLHIQFGVMVVVQNGRNGYIQSNFGLGQYFIESVFVYSNGLPIFKGG